MLRPTAVVLLTALSTFGACRHHDAAPAAQPLRIDMRDSWIVDQIAPHAVEPCGLVQLPPALIGAMFRIGDSSSRAGRYEFVDFGWHGELHDGDGDGTGVQLSRIVIPPDAFVCTTTMLVISVVPIDNDTLGGSYAWSFAPGQLVFDFRARRAPHAAR